MKNEENDYEEEIYETIDYRKIVEDGRSLSVDVIEICGMEVLEDKNGKMVAVFSSGIQN